MSVRIPPFLPKKILHHHEFLQWHTPLPHSIMLQTDSFQAVLMAERHTSDWFVPICSNSCRNPYSGSDMSSTRMTEHTLMGMPSMKSHSLMLPSREEEYSWGGKKRKKKVNYSKASFYIKSQLKSWSMELIPSDWITKNTGIQDTDQLCAVFKESTMQIQHYYISLKHFPHCTGIMILSWI